MSLQFQVPAFVHAQDYSGLTKSIDNLFNAYAEGKLQGQQIAANQLNLQNAQQQQQQGLAAFRLANGGLTPQDVNQYLPQAMQPRATITASPSPLLPQQGSVPPMLAAQPQNMGQQITAPVVAPQQAPQPLGMVQAPEDPKLATVRALLAMHQQANQLGAAQQVAGLQKTQAEAQKAGAEAEMTAAQVALLGGTGSVVDNFINQMKSGKATLDDLGAFGRGEVANAIKAGVMAKASALGLDTNAIANQQASAKKLAEAGAMPAAVTKSIMPSLDILDHLADVAGKDSWQTINKFGLKVAAEKGDRTANAILTQADVIAEGAQNIYGAGSDSKLAVFQKALNAAKTQAQLKDSTQILRADFGNRIAALKNQPTDSSNPVNLPGKITPAQKAPAIGTIEGGYKFRGGNPASPSSWVKL